MEKQKTVITSFWPVLGLLCLMGLTAGCQNQCQVTFRDHMDLGIEAVQAGDLAMAQEHIDEVRPCAKTYEQKRMVESMDGLISGAQAMMNGDPTQARADWANIPDPHLNRQVRINADVVMGLKVPILPEEEKEVQK